MMEEHTGVQEVASTPSTGSGSATGAPSTSSGSALENVVDLAAGLYTHAEELKQLLAQGTLTRAELLRELDWKEAKLSFYINKNYHIKTKVSLDAIREHDKRIGEYLQRFRLRQAASGNKPFFPTSHAQRLEGYLDLCFSLRKMRVILGGTGLGKTATFSHYKAAKSGIYIMECEPTSGKNKERGFVEQLYYAIFGEVMPPTLWTRQGFLRVQEELKGKDCLLIVDEAQELDFAQFSEFRFLYDKCGIGILICQQSDAKDSPGYDRTQHYFRNPQFLRRIGGQTWNLNEEPILKEDVALIAGYYGITNPAVITWLHDRMNTPVTRYGWLLELMEMGNMLFGNAEAMNTVAALQELHKKLRQGR
jgi:hypothetical protein